MSEAMRGRPARPLGRSLRIRLLIGFVQRFLNAMLLPFMAIYLDRRFGQGHAATMVLAGVLLGILAGLYGGHLSERLGRRPVLLLSESGAAAAFAAMAVAAMPSWDSPIAVYAFFVLANALGNLGLPAHDAVIIDVTHTGDRKRVYTLNYWTINLALVGGSLAGAAFFPDHLPHMLAMAAVLGAGMALLTFVLVGETRPRRDGPRGRGRPGIARVLADYGPVVRDGALLRFVLAATMLMALEVQLTNYIAVRLARSMPEQDLVPFGPWEVRVDGAEMVGVLRGENTLLIVLLALFAERFLKRLREGPRLYGGIAAYTAGYVLLGVGSDVSLLLFGMLIATLGELLYVGVEQARLADSIPEASRTRHIAVYNLHVRAALVVGTLTWSATNVLPGWFVPALYTCLGVGAAFLYRAVPARRQEAEPVEPAARQGAGV
ncbi:MFS transporter [Actinomadura vinacea]|uniref:MFS transporter n=1 Tax=Actinomadura vinacea TaxID=115336 RepID=A0ABP5WX84_9ACTN